MLKNLYIAAAEADSGKSLVMMGIMSILSRHVKRLGFFRPIVQLENNHDHDIDLVSKRMKIPFQHDEMFGLTSSKALDLLQENNMDDLLTTILNKYKKLEANCDFVVVEGTDFTGSLKPFEFDFNTRLANNLGAPVLTVVNGHGKSVTDIADITQMIKAVLAREKCNYVGMFVNRANNKDIDAIWEMLVKFKTNDEIVFIIPELDVLQKLTIRQISKALNAEKIYGDDDVFDYDVNDFKVAAMGIGQILKYTGSGCLVITPGDRSDVLITLFMSLLSENHEKIAGILLSGGINPDPEVMRLINGVKKLPVAILKVDTDTFATAMNVNNIKALLTPDNERRMAMALGHFETNVDGKKLIEKIALTPAGVVTPIMFEYQLYERAGSKRKHIVLPEGLDDRILRASEILLRRDVVDLTLLGNEEEILKKADSLHLKLNGINIIDPYDNDLINDYAATYFKLRKHKGITKEEAHEIMYDVSYLGTMMVFKGHADGMVSGAAHTTQHTIRPAFEFIKTKPGFSIVSSSFLMLFEDKVLVYGDCAFNPNPNSEELADIAISSAQTALSFGIEPRIAMLSYSTGTSGKGEEVEKVRKATEIARSRRPDLKIEGPIQYDAAIDATVASQKMPNSDVAGKATVFIFPDLNTGNNTYKAVQRSSGAIAVGPVSQGLNKPVNDLSRGCLVKDIVSTVLITAIQAQET
ncbi:MAG: phosphate acetyltransferase [Bacteroidales bacterium]|nr:phosphate acetyltransferase [Bacteroidales bacterium]